MSETPSAPGKWKCPACGKEMMGPDEHCGGAFTERGHPAAVKPEFYPAEAETPSAPVVPEEAMHPAARIIAASLRQRHDQIVEGRMGDRQTETPNQIAERALAAALPALHKHWEAGVREREKRLVEALERFANPDRWLEGETGRVTWMHYIDGDGAIKPWEIARGALGQALGGQDDDD
jgi:hypothetical protein